jgi:hypothetical protein
MLLFRKGRVWAGRAVHHHLLGILGIWGVSVGSWGVGSGMHRVVLGGDGLEVGAVHGGCGGIGGGGRMLCEGRRVNGIVVIHHVVHARIGL